jgi:hypothetical protein
MSTNRLNYLLLAALLITTLLSGVISSGCVSKYEQYYKKYTMNEGIVRFSFEYPKDYLENSYDSSNREVRIWLSELFAKDGPDKDLSIMAELSTDNINAKTRMEESLSYIRDGEVLEKSPVKVGGVQGYKFVIRYERKPVKIERNIYFDFGGWQWILITRSTEALSAEAESEFEHLVKTFKFLKPTVPANSRYRLFAENESIAHFSLEYPVDYNSYWHYRSNWDYTNQGWIPNSDVTISFSRQVVNNGWFDKSLVIDASVGERDIQTQLEKVASGLLDQFKTARILEKSSVNISNMLR